MCPQPPPETSDRLGIVLQNEAEAPPALLEDWLRARRIPSRTALVWEDGVPDDPTRFAWIAALGSVHSAAQSAPDWIPAEIEFLRRAVAANVPVLGICFGGQALSVALGGAISPADPITIGWFEVETDDPGLVSTGPWVHFNSESFSIPDGATPIARSPGGPGAFRIGPSLGVQFHAEVTPAIVDSWRRSDADKLAELGIDPDEIRIAGERYGPRAPPRAFDLFDAWRLMASSP